MTEMRPMMKAAREDSGNSNSSHSLAGMPSTLGSSSWDTGQPSAFLSCSTTSAAITQHARVVITVHVQVPTGVSTGVTS